MKKINTSTLAGVGILTAIVFVLQLISMNVKFGPFSITLALMPIVIGAALYGWKAGAWLGFVFGCITLFDAAPFLAVNAPGAVFTCLAKGTLAGLIAGLVFSAVSKKNRLAAIIAAAVVCPVVNTGTFFICCALFFMETVKQWAGDTNVVLFMFVGLAGVNFLVELGVNLVLSSIAERVLAVISPKKAQAA